MGNPARFLIGLYFPDDVAKSEQKIGRFHLTKSKDACLRVVAWREEFVYIIKWRGLKYS
jgi:hypothetical protein